MPFGCHACRVYPRRWAAARSSLHLATLVTLFVTMGVLAGACSLVESGAERSMHAHAANAATVLENEPSSAYATDAVRRVLGTGTDDTITVLAARGTLRDGFIELRIHVLIRPDSEFGNASSATGCFDYTLDYFTHPDQVDCPDAGPMRLPPPHPVTTTTVS